MTRHRCGPQAAAPLVAAMCWALRGLERSVVVLCANGFKNMSRAGEQLYVGLSRARSLLVVVGDANQQEQAGGRGLQLALSRSLTWKPPRDN